MQYSVISYNDLDHIVFRLDSEYYQPAYIELEKDLARYEIISIREAKGSIDCSAFYPSIVQFYNSDGRGIPFLRVNEIQNGLLYITKDTVFLPEEVLNENQSTIAKCYPGDLIIAKGGNSLAKIALLTEEYGEYSICRDVVVLRTGNLQKLDKYYLWIFLHSNIGQKLLLRTASQTGQPHLTVEAIYQLGIPMLSETFQGAFEQLYKKSWTLRQGALDKYTQAQSLLLSELGLSSWKPKHQLSFVKNYSVTDKAARIDAEYFQPKYDEIVKAIKGYSGGWDTLGNITSIKKCVEVGSEAYIDEGKIPFVRVSNLSPFEITEEKYISDELYAELSQHQPQQGEILFSKDGTSGIAYHLNEKPKKMITSGGILRLKIRNKQINEDYLTLVLNSLIVQEQINRDVGGSIILHWRPDQVKQTLIPILDDEKQKKIRGEIAESFDLRKQSKRLLQCAKRAVENAIEQNEDVAIKWLQAQTKEAGHGEQDDKRQPKRL